MKKLLVLILILLTISVSGCKENTKSPLTILFPEGIPSIALGGLYDREDLEFRIVSGPDVLTSELVQDHYDVIVAPITAAAKLYMNGASEYHFAAVLTTGNSYIVSRKETPLSSLEDLEGKVVASYGEGNTPDIILKAALSSQEVNTTIVYEASINDVVTNRFMSLQPVDYILCAEPVLSNLENKMGIELNIINLQTVLENDIAFIPQAGIFVKELNEDILALLEDIDDNVIALNEDPTSYASLLVKLDPAKYPLFQSLGEETIALSIPRSEIFYARSINIKPQLTQYLNMINTYNSKILGGNIPDENFIQ
ncbi:MAG: ABC transporter substrate-binding protein [Bacilli bacterium]|nr:ABC transporter substrate-binding protein [Bacilli bacterium]